MKEITFEEALKALEDGKKVYINGGSDYVMMNELNIPISYRSGGSIICWNCSIGCSCGKRYYIPEEPKPFEIIETGLYRLKNGRKAFISFLGKKTVSGLIDGYKNHTIWEYNGSVNGVLTTEFDIIEKWED